MKRRNDTTNSQPIGAENTNACVGNLMYVELEKRWATDKSVRFAFEHDFSSQPVVAIVGPSGVGKTTLLRMICGLCQPTSGIIAFRTAPSPTASATNAPSNEWPDSENRKGDSLRWFDATERVNLPPRKRDCVMGFSEPRLFPHLTARDNIFVGINKRARDQLPPAIETFCDAMEIASILEQKPFELSTGQAQRVSLARSMIRSAHLHLLDEPISNVDGELLQRLVPSLREWVESRKLRVILVTHQQRLADQIADRVLGFES